MSAPVSLASIELDTSIQCRASIDTATVNEYAERMTEGDKFPPVILFGTRSNCWIADGWHRVLARLQLGDETIGGELREGGRDEALRWALSANALHGQRRTNADKRRCVEIALREFGDLSSRALGTLCGVDHKTVAAVRSNGEVPQSITTTDGRQYPTRRPEPEPEDSEDDASPPPASKPGLGPPCVGMQYARMAIMDLEQITSDDAEHDEALDHVRRWLDAKES